jgi:hypothetical protein
VTRLQPAKPDEAAGEGEQSKVHIGTALDPDRQRTHHHHGHHTTGRRHLQRQRLHREPIPFTLARTVVVGNKPEECFGC